jgi:hypothetical protein
MEARYQLRQSPSGVTGSTRSTSLTDPTFEVPDGPIGNQPFEAVHSGGFDKLSRPLIEDEDWQPLRSVSVHEYGPQHAVEDQMHSDDVR